MRTALEPHDGSAVAPIAGIIPNNGHATHLFAYNQAQGFYGRGLVVRQRNGVPVPRNFMVPQ